MQGNKIFRMRGGYERARKLRILENQWKCEDSRSVLELSVGPFIKESVRELNLLRQSGGSLVK